MHAYRDVAIQSSATPISAFQCCHWLEFYSAGCYSHRDSQLKAQDSPAESVSLASSTKLGRTMETVEMAVSPCPQSQCFSLACLLMHAHTHCTHMHTAAWITTARSQTPGETIINDELCDPVSVQRKLTFPLIPRDILLTSHLSFIESWSMMY